MNDIRIFQNPAFGEIRVMSIDGEPWFVAADVCKALEIGNSRQAVARLDEDERNTVILSDGNRGNPNVTVVSEAGLYGLVLSSRKKEAKAFKRWIKHDVLPSIRKTGGYIHGAESMTDAELLAQAVLVANRTIAEREARINSLQAEIAAFAPMREYVQTILSSTGTMTTTQIAADYGISARELNKILHAERIQWKTNGQWVLYREHMNKGYTQSVTIPITHSDGTPDTRLHTQWTQKGRLMIHEILTRRGLSAKAVSAEASP